MESHSRDLDFVTRRLAGGLVGALALLVAVPLYGASVKPGDLVSPDNAAVVADLVSPGNFALVKQGMRMKIVSTDRLEWPPPYKAATEKYSAQVKLNERGELSNYVAGLPFPLLDPNDPQVATKVMWNFSFRPQYTDDADIRDVEVSTNAPGKPVGGILEHFTIEHFAFYNNVGRTEVPPVPTDPEATGPGIRYRFGAYPFLEPQELHGAGIIRQRNIDPTVDDNVWYIHLGRARRVRAEELSDAIAPHVEGDYPTYVNNLDPDSYFGFSAKIETYDYKLLGIKPMLASVHAENVPAKACEFDNHRTVCPEAWEMRQLYIVEANAKTLSWHQRIGSSGVTIPKRVLYIDSEGWFITGSDQYDPDGKLWKTIATFNTYRDRPIPDAKTAIYPFKRMFQVALVDENLQNGYSSVIYMPGQQSEDRECWYVNMGIVTKAFLDPHKAVVTSY
jgi:hypothetical protein